MSTGALFPTKPERTFLAPGLSSHSMSCRNIRMVLTHSVTPFSLIYSLNLCGLNTFVLHPLLSTDFVSGLFCAQVWKVFDNTE